MAFRACLVGCIGYANTPLIGGPHISSCLVQCIALIHSYYVTDVIRIFSAFTPIPNPFQKQGSANRCLFYPSQPKSISTPTLSLSLPTSTKVASEPNLHPLRSFADFHLGIFRQHQQKRFRGQRFTCGVVYNLSYVTIEWSAQQIAEAWGVAERLESACFWSAYWKIQQRK
ncbi:uncharacterized protein LOC105804705 isoform X1 [Gossypium raimondii]|uniref:uncharacterized protein LOC105804705 isoform X1 n=1 Tax=Gossypium raimondii TaxID=29730 RepID=UPI00227C11DC|nr:uncharacterized protein LOC105804705 isoform X1 [Gossypium raimondii]